MLDAVPTTSKTMEEKADRAYWKMRSALQEIYFAQELGTSGSSHKVEVPFPMLTQAGELRDVKITIQVSEKPHKMILLKDRKEAFNFEPRSSNQEGADADEDAEEGDEGAGYDAEE